MKSTRSHDAPRRTQVTDAVAQRQAEYERIGHDVDDHAQDAQVLQETADGLDLGGTQDAAEAVKQAMDAAERLTADEFDKDGQRLSEAQAEGQSYEQELNDRGDTARTDAGRIQESDQRLRDASPRAELERAATQVQEDLRFLEEAERVAREHRDASQRAYEEAQRQLQAAKAAQGGAA